jgi:hypothetical protein
MASKGKKSKSTFRAAVAETAALAPHFKPGIQALEEPHRRRITNGHLATGSVDYDKALQPTAPNDHRVDYGIGLPVDKTTEKVLWLEVHHAASGETERVVRKFQEIINWLPENAPRLWKLPRAFIWQLTNTESNPNDRRKRNQFAAKYGIRRVQGVLNLASL